MHIPLTHVQLLCFLLGVGVMVWTGRGRVSSCHNGTGAVHAPPPPSPLRVGLCRSAGPHKRFHTSRHTPAIPHVPAHTSSCTSHSLHRHHQPQGSHTFHFALPCQRQQEQYTHGPWPKGRPPTPLKAPARIEVPTLITCTHHTPGPLTVCALFATCQSPQPIQLLTIATTDCSLRVTLPP